MGFDLIYLFEGISLWPFNAGMVQRATSDKNFLFFLYVYTLTKRKREDRVPVGSSQRQDRGGKFWLRMDEAVRRCKTGRERKKEPVTCVFFLNTWSIHLDSGHLVCC